MEAWHKILMVLKQGLMGLETGQKQQYRSCNEMVKQIEPNVLSLWKEGTL